MTAPECEYQSRIARKQWECRGNGAHGPRHAHAEGCVGTIEPGDLCVELLDETPAFSSGPRLCLACAEAFHGIDTALLVADRKGTD